MTKNEHHSPRAGVQLGFIIAAILFAAVTYYSQFDRRADLIASCERGNDTRTGLHTFAEGAAISRENEAMLAAEDGRVREARSSADAAEVYRSVQVKLESAPFVDPETAETACSEAIPAPWPFGVAR